MNDKNKHELQVGDPVKIFSYTKGKVISFETRQGVEMARVEGKWGQWVVYSDEIRKAGKNEHI